MTFVAWVIGAGTCLGLFAVALFFLVAGFVEAWRNRRWENENIDWPDDDSRWPFDRWKESP